MPQKRANQPVYTLEFFGPRDLKTSKPQKVSLATPSSGEPFELDPEKFPMVFSNLKKAYDYVESISSMFSLDNPLYYEKIRQYISKYNKAILNFSIKDNNFEVNRVQLAIHFRITKKELQ